MTTVEQNKALYTELYKNNRTNLKVAKIVSYFSIGCEVYKIVTLKNTISTLISTMGISFFVGTLCYFHKVTPNQLIKFTPLSELDKQIIPTQESLEKDDTEEEESEDEEEDYDDIEIDENTKKLINSINFRPSFNHFRFYGFIPFGVLGGVIGNGIGTVALWAKYGSHVAIEWNQDYYMEITTYILGTTFLNNIVFGGIDLVMKLKYFFSDKKRVLKQLEDKKTK